MAFFHDILQKNYYSHPHISSKNVHSPPMPKFCHKTFIFPKLGALKLFFSNFSWKTPVVIPIFGLKNDILLLTKKVYFGYRFFPFFMIKSLLACHILSKKVVSLKKTLLACPFFVKKHSRKITRISCHFFQIFSGKFPVNLTELHYTI